MRVGHALGRSPAISGPEECVSGKPSVTAHDLGSAVSNLDVLADANDQFHWGATVEAVAAALRNLRARNLNPILAELLEGKIASMEAVEAHESLHALRVAPSRG